MTELGSQRGGGQAFSLLNNCTPPRNGQRTCENVSECSFPGGKKKKRQAFPMMDVQKFASYQAVLASQTG